MTKSGPRSAPGSQQGAGGRGAAELGSGAAGAPAASGRGRAASSTEEDSDMAPCSPPALRLSPVCVTPCRVITLHSQEPREPPWQLGVQATELGPPPPSCWRHPAPRASSIPQAPGGAEAGPTPVLPGPCPSPHLPSLPLAGCPLPAVRAHEELFKGGLCDCVRHPRSEPTRQEPSLDPTTHSRSLQPAGCYFCPRIYRAGEKGLEEWML